MPNADCDMDQDRSSRHAPVDAQLLRSPAGPGKHVCRNPESVMLVFDFMLVAMP